MSGWSLIYNAIYVILYMVTNKIEQFRFRKQLPKLRCREDLSYIYIGNELGQKQMMSLSFKGSNLSEIKERDTEIKLSKLRFGYLIENNDLNVIEFEEICRLYEEIINSKAADDAYSASERICNVVIYVNKNMSLSIKQGNKLRNLLFKDVSNIERKIECYGVSRTNNHLLNNIRALLVIGASFKDSNYVSKMVSILNEKVINIINDDGCLREGSSHYQKIVTRWVCDICISLKSVKNRHANYYNELLEKMINISIFQSLGRNHRDPIIGDVSPDFTPSFTSNYLGILKDGGNDSDRCVQNWMSNDGDWIKYTSKGYDVIAHVESNPHRPRADHSHADSLSFVAAYSDKDIVVDLGRRTYMSNSHEFMQATESNYHNSININGQSLTGIVKPYMNRKWLKKNITKYSVQLLVSGIFIQALDVKNIKNVKSVGRKILVEDESIIITNEIIFDELVNDYEIKMNFNLSGAVMINGNNSQIHIANEEYRIETPVNHVVTATESSRFTRYMQDINYLATSLKYINIFSGERYFSVIKIEKLL